MTKSRLQAKAVDPLALQIAQAVHQRENPQATILFGSRARGDYEERRSDIDIMLVVPKEPSRDYKLSLEDWTESKVRALYGRNVPLQLVWFSRTEFEDKRRFINHVVTRAMLDGVIMSTNPEEFQSTYSNETTEDQDGWTEYEQRLEDAERHREDFNITDDLKRPDKTIGEHAHHAFEHAIKAIISGHSGTPSSTGRIGRLLETIGRIDDQLVNFELSIDPQVYSEYAEDSNYKTQRTTAPLTNHYNYRDLTDHDLNILIERARQLGPNLRQ